jgi:hypothetical protein
MKAITTKQPQPEAKPNKWTQRLLKQQEKQLVIDSRETSHFASEEFDLPDEGQSRKTVPLPNGETIQTTTKTSLPFK